MKQAVNDAYANTYLQDWQGRGGQVLQVQWAAGWGPQGQGWDQQEPMRYMYKENLVV